MVFFLPVLGRIIIKWIVEKLGGRESVDLISLVQDMDHWPAVTETVI
jgi:hypothetical protein